MVWAKLDDAILDNPKVSRAGPLGFALHVAAITWCCRNLSDGFIPIGRVGSLLDFSDYGLSQYSKDPRPVHPAVDAIAVADWLVDCGLWDRSPGGYQLHDFLDYNPSRDKVQSERQRGADRKQASRDGSRPPRMMSVRTPPGLRAESVTASDGPDPDPDPVPNQERSISIGTASPPPEAIEAPKPRRRKPETACPESDASRELIALWAVSWKIPTEHAEFDHFLDHHRKNDTRWRDWAAAWRTWLKNASRFSRGSAPRGAEITKQPYDPNAPWMKLPEVSNG